jgi:hypothetical protein
MKNNDMYLTNSNGISKINISDGTSIEWISDLGDLYGIAIVGNNMYVTNGNGISKINISNGTIIEWISGLIRPRGIAIKNNDMYVTNYYNGTIDKFTLTPDLNTPKLYFSRIVQL